ncbi:hypothetical protein AMATHDRAFT_47697 [Amanita thiersii Skay4041]|uniref:Uncharacterized protein n=1 Tax=Amanita thiersii Skay4041 TaxID=703135 RepID=A0A2A9NSN5_9AGAR|nr:hypothetical protein AMATHDRAFT_47697 [Amanita thiersii Skay4041]
MNFFRVARLVLYSLIVNSTLLLLVFASWNIHATLSGGPRVPCEPIIMIMTCYLTFIFLILGFSLGIVWVECLWSFVVALTQGAFYLSHPCLAIIQVCSSASPVRLDADRIFQDNWSICTSTSLLVPLGWLSSFIAWLYFFILFITVLANISVYPGIWKDSVNDIDLFGFLPARKRRPDLKWSRRDAENLNIWDENAARRFSVAPWAKTTTIRRGVDLPFSVKSVDGTESTSSVYKMPLPDSPRAALVRQMHNGSLFVENIDRDSVHVEDSDFPVQHSNKTMWVPADAIIGGR